jgi:methyl-accepting chemotaxis protein/methyl-accepting chemotaxis protein-1 (serine sensor receptor)
VDEVNLGSQEQARGIEEIGRAISQMEQVTQKTAANSEECASAAEELNAQSAALNAIVERLSWLVSGSAGAGQPARRGPSCPNSHGPASSMRQKESSRGVAALASAVLGEPGRHAGPVPPSASAGKALSPLEDDFKEF